MHLSLEHAERLKKLMQRARKLARAARCSRDPALSAIKSEMVWKDRGFLNIGCSGIVADIASPSRGLGSAVDELSFNLKVIARTTVWDNR